jgi:hypothetical protein
VVFLSLTLGFASGLKAQNLSEVISNLKSELSKNPDDKKRASIYSDLTWYYASVSVDSALSYGKKPFRQLKNFKILLCWRRFTVIWERFIFEIMISKIQKKII